MKLHDDFTFTKNIENKKISATISIVRQLHGPFPFSSAHFVRVPLEVNVGPSNLAVRTCRPIYEASSVYAIVCVAKFYFPDSGSSIPGPVCSHIDLWFVSRSPCMDGVAFKRSYLFVPR